MADKTQGKKTYTVADLYAEAALMVREELQAIKHESLSSTEDTKAKELARAISKMVLKEMKLA